VDYIGTQPPLSAEAWKASVVKMQEKYGASIPPGDVDKLVDYLVTYYGTAAKK
jgi:hypothetical protein